MIPLLGDALFADVISPTDLPNNISAIIEAASLLAKAMAPAAMETTVTDETPLLPVHATEHEMVYDRFSKARKKVIVALVSWCGLIPFFSGGTFIPSIPEIARDLNTTPAIINFSISLSVFAGCIGGLMGATYSTYYGRRPTYLTGLPLFCISTFGVSLSRTASEVLAYRFLQALGSSPGMAVGAGVIGDIYKLEERGTAMGIFFAAMFLGLALAPPVGGFVTEYYSWRILQVGLGIAGMMVVVVIFIAFPETSHPGARGVDSAPSNASKLAFVNPLRPLSLLKSPNLVSVSLTSFTMLSTNYVLLVPLAYTFGKQYGITNPTLIGLCFVPPGLGNILGAPIAGRISDRIIVEYRAKRGGLWYPEDRLRASTFSAATLVPLSTFLSGVLTAFVPGRVGLVLNLVCLFVNGIGIDMALSPAAAYVVDVLHHRSAEAMAAYNASRHLLLSLSIACILPMIEAIGVFWTNAISAALSILGCILLLFTIKYGDELRAWMDVGYATDENN